MFLFKTCLFVTRRKIQDNTTKTIKLQIIVPTWNDEFELPDDSYSVSDIQEYIEYFIKSMKHCLLIVLVIFTSIGLITD